MRRVCLLRLMGRVKRGSLFGITVTVGKSHSHASHSLRVQVEIDEMLGRIEDEEIPRLRTSKRALMVQTELLRLAQVAARRVQYLQQCDM